MNDPTPTALSPTRGQLQELVAQLEDDQRARWQRGERVRVEDYLERHPALRDEPETVVDLVYNEFLLRQQRGETPQPEEYLERFPDLAESLRRQFEVHQFVPPLAPAGKLPDVPGYDVLGEIGSGGMGVVYKARHLGLNRLVALKMILAGPHARPEEQARFQAEAEIIARFQHPHIVQIYEVGSHAGLPYFALEFVDGPSLDRKVQGTPQPEREAARLMEVLAQAAHYAHAHGVVHRDLKPANVLLTADGTPKITDFGLAKRLDSPLGQTRTGELLGTPSYMAPEQAAARPKEIGPHTDVYALGAILYELLTGRPPFKAETALETARQVVHDPPVRPSRLRPRLARDLETICLKCLEKEPVKRYASAAALADDLRRFLDGRPILARPAGTVERTWRWCRRNPGLASMAASLAVLLVSGIAVSSALAIYALRGWDQADQNAYHLDQANTDLRDSLGREKAERQRAEDSEKTAKARETETRAVLDFVLDRVFAAARPKGQQGGLGHDVTLRQAVEAALPFVDKSFADQPQIEARLRHALGMSFSYLGEPLAAAEQFEKALTLHARHNGPDESDTLASMNGLAVCYDELGRHDDALKLHEKTLALLRAKHGPAHPHTLASMHNLAVSYSTLGRHDEALELRIEMLALWRAKLGPDHPNTLMGLNNLAISYAALGRHADALRLRQETLALQKATLPPAHPHTLASMHNLANSYDALGRHDEALKLYEETLVLQKAKLGAVHTDTLRTMHNLATCYNSLGRHVDALKLYEETWTLQKDKLGPDHPNTLRSVWGVAESLVWLGRGAEAVPVIDECVRRAAGKAVDPSLLPTVMDLRLRHFEKTRDAAGCRATAEMWEKLNRADAESLHTAARMRSVTAAVTQEDTSIPGPDVTRLAQEQAGRAMDWLRKAVAAGYFRDSQRASALKKDKDFDAPRDREDFQKLLGELEAPKQ